MAKKEYYVGGDSGRQVNLKLNAQDFDKIERLAESLGFRGRRGASAAYPFVKAVVKAVAGLDPEIPVSIARNGRFDELLGKCEGDRATA